MTEPFYVAVKASLHASDSSVFGLSSEEVNALSKRYPDSNREVINGVLIKASPLRVINSLCELGYRVVCSSGEAEIVWTLRRDVLDDSTEFECQVIPAERLRDLEAHNKLVATVEKDPVTVDDADSSNQALARVSCGSCEEKNSPPTKPGKKDVERIGTKPEDFTTYSEYKGPKIMVRNVSSLDTIEEGIPVIVNTNAASSQNPLIGSYHIYASQYLSEVKMNDTHQCNNPSHRNIGSVHQTLDEMDFDRGIWTPAMTGDVEKLRNHLAKGTQPDVEDKAGYTALHYAARCGFTHVCAILLEAGASVNKKTKAGGATALHRAALSGHQDVCRLLLGYGADPLSKDVDGRIPLHRAVEGGHKNVILQLIEASPSSAFEKDNFGKTPLDYAEEKGALSSLFACASKTT